MTMILPKLNSEMQEFPCALRSEKKEKKDSQPQKKEKTQEE